MSNIHSPRSFKPLVLNSQEIQTRLKVVFTQAITSSIRDLEDEEHLLHRKHWVYETQHIEKKDCLQVVEQALTTMDSMEMMIRNCQRDVMALSEARNNPKYVMAEIEEMLGGHRLDHYPMPCFSPSSPTPLSPRIPRFDSKPDLSRVDKSTQADSVSGDQSYLESIERRHYVYMLEAFRSLRFSIDIFSPVEIMYPKRSKWIPESNSRS